MQDITFTLAELTKIKLEPGEVLAVKLFGNDFSVENMEPLKDMLKESFPNNKVILFMMPEKSDIQFEAIKPQAKSEADCSKETSYCSDCSCGKKERIESNE